MLRIKNLTVDHGAIRALHGVSISIEKGQLAAVIGANGAGKTTLLRTLSGLNKATIPELTVAENLDLGALWRRNRKESAQSKKEVVELFPRLGERLSQRADSLSGGERQMLAIGRSMMAKPQLLLLDEPSLGLAPLVVEQIFQSIRDLTNSLGLTVVLVEQNAMGALKIADIGIVLNLGSIAATGSAAALRDDPAVRAAYLGF
jgi:branched-chain amino acid transport system ATP-binding protein